jgi:uncharacterized protein YxeA
MRKIVFIVLAVIVAATVVIFSIMAFSTPTINFVADNVIIDDSRANNSEYRLKIQRLFAAEVDHDKYERALEEITNLTDYTDEEIFAAAVASGNPEFFPVFNFHVYAHEDEIRINGFIEIDVAEGQTTQKFKMGQVNLEAAVYAGDLEIQRVDVNPAPNTDIEIITPQQSAADITNATTFEFALTGDTGEITLQFLYEVKTDSFFNKIALEEQILLVDFVISHDAWGRMVVEFFPEPYSNLEELEG